MKKNKILVFFSVLILVISCFFVCCFSSFAVNGGDLTIRLYDYYKSSSTGGGNDNAQVYYELSNPQVEIFNRVDGTRFDAINIADIKRPSFDYYYAQDGVNDDKTKVSFSFASTELYNYYPSDNIYYRFTFDVRIFWAMNFLAEPYNLDMLFSTETTGGFALVQSPTFTYVQFIDLNEQSQTNNFYYSNIANSGITYPYSSVDMRLYQFNHPLLRVTVSGRFISGEPKVSRSIEMSFILNSESADNSYVPKYDINDYDDFLNEKNDVSNTIGTDVVNVWGDLISQNNFNNTRVIRSVRSVSFLGMTFISDDLWSGNGYNIFDLLIRISLSLGILAFVIGVGPTMVGGFVRLFSNKHNTNQGKKNKGKKSTASAKR